jgi:hypothetical protein
MSVIDQVGGVFFLYLLGEIEENQINVTESGQCYGRDLHPGSLELSQI